MKIIISNKKVKLQTRSASRSLMSVAAFTDNFSLSYVCSLKRLDNVWRPPSSRNFRWANGKCRTSDDNAASRRLRNATEVSIDNRRINCCSAPASTAAICTAGLLYNQSINQFIGVEQKKYSGKTVYNYIRPANVIGCKSSKHCTNKESKSEILRTHTYIETEHQTRDLNELYINLLQDNIIRQHCWKGKCHLLWEMLLQPCMVHLYICVCHSCSLLKALDRRMPFGRDTPVVPSNTVLDSSPSPPRKGRFRVRTSVLYSEDKLADWAGRWNLMPKLLWPLLILLSPANMKRVCNSITVNTEQNN